MRSLVLVVWLAAWSAMPVLRAQLPMSGNLSRSNLVAWCIVPFDSQKRSPVQRAEMLQRLGIQRLAYDWRAEHIPSFDAEVDAMAARGIEMTAWWFPAVLNSEAKAILATIERKRIHPQLWITMGTEPEPNPERLEAKLADAVNTLAPICRESARLGCTVALYNHLGWFGEPTNAVRVVQRLQAAGHRNVGIVYNLHHAHDHIDDFADALRVLKPHLLALNLNGMVRGGDKAGRKIIPLGTGDQELEMLRVLHASGWSGPVGIIGHTDEDAEAKLRKELAGLERLAPLSLLAPSPRPRNLLPPPAVHSLPARAREAQRVPGNSGLALDARVGGIVANARPEVRGFPLTVDAWVRLGSASGFNILVASEAKASPTHWEFYTYAGSGALSWYMPGARPAEIVSPVSVCDGQWHRVRASITASEVALWVDGKLATRQFYQRDAQPVGPAQYAIGRLVEGGIGCDGFLDEVRLLKGAVPLDQPDAAHSEAGLELLAHGSFEKAPASAAPLLASVGEVRLAKAATASSPASSAPGAAPTRKPGEPAVSGKEPGVQGERDWVDNRWQQTDLGPVFAATLKMPDGATVTRALAVRLGTDAAVAYDTATGSWRGAWSGDFIRFDPARFGLIGTPGAAGTPALNLAKETAWPGASPRMEAMERPDDSHVVLRWSVHGSPVHEVASVLETGAGRVWVRTLEIPAHDAPWTFVPGMVVAGSSATSEATSSDFSISLLGKKPSKGPRDGVRSRGHGVASEGDRATGLAWLASEASGIEVGGFGGNEAVRITLAATQRPMVLAVVAWAGKVSDAGRFRDEVKRLPMPPHPSVVARLERRADRPLKTQGQRGSDSDFLAVDTLTMPYENPYHALLFGAGVDVAPDGAVYVCTIHGDVWKVTGVDDDLRELTWRRFATGLYQPLGLKVVEGKVHVLGRDRITRLEDRNGDGHADLHATYFDGIATSAGGHDYVAGLEVDAAGRLYYADPNGLHRVEKDGSRATTLATGFRNPNSLGVRGLEGTTPVVTVSPQQGTWTPSSGIWEVRDGLYGGYGGPRKTASRPEGYDAPLCWIPHGVDNSSGSQAWIPGGQWGALGGLPLHLMWGRCGALLLLRDTDASGAGVQAAVTPLPVKFLSGPNRASFNPRDGSLLVAGSTGWQTSAVKDGALQRVRFTGKPVNVPVGWRVVPGGMELRFASPVDPATASDPGSYAVRAWNYRYAEAYGSKDWSLKDPSKPGRDEWTVASVKVEAGGRSVVLSIPELGPVMQGELKYNVSPADGGKPWRGSLWFTVHRH